MSSGQAGGDTPHDMLHGLMSNASSTTQEQLRAHLTRLALPINEPVVHYLVTGRGLCGDLDSVLILLVIIQRANRHPDFPHLVHEDLVHGHVAEIPTLAANLHSIADSTGIPRETVRRKVGQLAAAGWVVREGVNVRLTVEGYRAADPLREAAIRLAGMITDAVNRVLVDRPPSTEL